MIQANENGPNSIVGETPILMTQPSPDTCEEPMQTAASPIDSRRPSQGLHRFEVASARMVNLEYEARPRRSRRAQFIVVGVVLAAVLVATVSFLLVSGAKEGSSAIGRVKRAVEPVLADHRQQAEATGGEIAVDWSATQMPGGQMVQTMIRSSVPKFAGRAVFMVESRSGVITPQDPLAATLLGSGATPTPHS